MGVDGLLSSSDPMNATKNANINAANSISIEVSCITVDVVLRNVVVTIRGAGTNTDVLVVMLISVNVE